MLDTPTDTTRSSSMYLGLLITVGVPLVAQLASQWWLMPGISPELAGSVNDAAQLSVFALGIQPLVSAYVMIEIVAFFVPRWSRLRHEPAGRAQIDRFVGPFAIALTIVQAFGVALYLDSLADDGGNLIGEVATSRWLLMACLIGGVCLQWIAARWITRQGLLNGIVALVTADMLRDLYFHVGEVFNLDWPGVGPHMGAVPHDFDLRGALLSLASCALVIVGTWIVLRASLLEDTVSDVANTPIRLHAPLPSSSFQTHVIALAVYWVPDSLTPYARVFGDVARTLRDQPALSLVLCLVLVIAVAWLLAHLLHRPVESVALIASVSGSTAAHATRALRLAIARVWWPSLTFLSMVMIAACTSSIEVSVFAVCVPVALDLVHAMRGVLRHPDWVCVWQERRVTAVPLLRNLLSEYGIPSETRGQALLAFRQLFLAYAPARVFVPPTHAEDARSLLADYSTGDAEAVGKATPRDIVAAPTRMPQHALLICLVVSLGLYGASYVPSTPASTDVPKTTFRLVRIDDALDPLRDRFMQGAAMEEDALTLATELVPFGEGQQDQRVFVTADITPGQTREAVLSRVTKWLADVPLPEGTRFAFETFIDDSSGTATTQLRSHVLVGASALHETDVIDAELVDVPSDNGIDVELRITLSEDGTRRLREVTGDWIHRRVAILINGEVISAPIVQSEINSSQLTLSTGIGDMDTKVARAKRWQAGLLAR